MMDSYSLYLLSTPRSAKKRKVKVLNSPEQLKLLEQPKVALNYKYTSFLESKVILPYKPENLKVIQMFKKPQSSHPESNKELEMKATQTCLKRTQPDSPKLSPHRLFGLSPAGAFKLPPTPRWAREKSSKPDTDGASGDHLLCETSCCEQEISAAGQDMISDLLKARIDRKIKSSLESARKHCKETRELINAKYGLKLEPVKLKSIDTKKELNTTDSPATSLSRTSLKTSITGKGADHLRRVVRSQIQMQEEFHQSMNKVTQLTDKLVMHTDNPQMLMQSVSRETFDLGDLGLGNKNSDPKPLTAKSVMDAKVMSPILRRVQRHYLKNLREEMKIIEDLERAPDEVDKIYKSFKYQLSRTL